MSKTLAQAMPAEFMGPEYVDARARKLAAVEVKVEHGEFSKRWPGREKHVGYWVELENGYAVGFNENPGRGWSFPVCKVPS